MSLVVKQWNVVAKVHEGRFGPGKFDLSELGRVGETEYEDVLVARVPDVDVLLEVLEEKYYTHCNFFEAIDEIRPVRRQFGFESIEEFQSRLADAALESAAPFESKPFDVRVFLRGETEELGAEEIRFRLRHALADHLGGSTKAVVNEEEPEMMLSIDTVDQTAGLATWTREEMERNPFLGLE